MKILTTTLVLSIVIVISGCTGSVETASSELDSFAECIDNNEVKMFGAYTCSVCTKQKALFGEAFEKIEEVECHPRGENAQTDWCLELNIEKTPTWMRFENGELVNTAVGFQTLEDLSEFSGCPLEVE
jgi:hypothetical protein